MKDSQYTHKPLLHVHVYNAIKLQQYLADLNPCYAAVEEIG